MCRPKNAGVAGYAEAFRPVRSDSQTSEWYSYFENDVLKNPIQTKLEPGLGLSPQTDGISVVLRNVHR